MAGFLSPATREQIRAASDIVDVIGSYLPLKRAGANFTALCPFHKEKSPSFNVNPHKQIFHCFGCHKGGDVFTFVKDYENIGFMDAVRRLAERAKIPLEFENSPGEQQSRHLKDQLLQIHDQIAQRWQNCLANEAAGQLARDYLQKRGVSADAIKLFRIGAAPEMWDDTVNWAKSKNYDLDLVEKAGLIIRKEETGNYYDRFRGRLMFPICDEQGRVVGFSGRVLSGDEKTAKYVNSPETAIFTKGKILFALDKAKKAILELGFAVVCEGQLDTIACHMGDVPNVVAPQGTALTAAHGRILRRYTNDIILCFDGDSAGQRAAARAFDDLLTAGIPFRVASIPPPDDPDSFIKKFGRDAFVRLLIGADDFHEFYLKFLCSQNNVQTNSGRQQIVRLMGESVRKTESPTLIDTFAQRTAQRLGVAADAIRQEFKKIPASKTAALENETETVSASQELPRPSPLEFHLLKLLLLHDELAATAALHLELDWIQNPIARQIIGQWLAAQQNETWKSLAAFLDECASPEMRNFVTEVVAEDRKIPNPEIQLADAMLALRNQFLDQEIQKLTNAMIQPGLSKDEQEQIVRRQQALKFQRKADVMMALKNKK
jgi:DNA primase